MALISSGDWKEGQSSAPRSRTRTHKVTLFALVRHGDCGFAVLLLDLERPVLKIALHVLVVHLAANKTLSVEYGVLGVGVVGVFGAVTDTRREPLSIIYSRSWRILTVVRHPKS
jgi:hypothetical protein